MKDDQQSPLSPAAEREEKVLKFWEEHRIFEKSLKKDAPRGNFVIFDGPPYATGMPHYGHLLPSTIKDAIPRFKTMQGFHAPRRWGWDCHGLPIENLIEKELGLEDKKAIINYGIDKFNKAARDSVFRYDTEWKKIIHRLGRWVDMDNNYQTMDPSYTESVWWSFRNLYDKGLIFEGFKSMHVCPRCETTLSNFEVGQGYADVQDISVYVLFKLKNSADEYVMAWTTTPWTLHGNVALAVNPELEYVKVKINSGTHAGKTVIMAKSRLDALPHIFKESDKAGGGAQVEIEKEVLESLSGAQFATRYAAGYEPVFNTYIDNKFPLEAQEEFRGNAWKIQTADFVTSEGGTGIVHIAPAFGDDDLQLAKAIGLPMIHHIGLDGHARAELGEPFAGQMVKPKAEPQAYDINVIKALAQSGALFAKEKITHSYPHCWRCNFPLLNYATSGWFLETTRLQQRLLDENAKVKWVPEEIGTGRFGAWLENVRDWNLSRSRFWGAPIPVWRGEKTGKIEVMSSVEELKSKLPKRNAYVVMRHGQSLSNLHNVISSKDLTDNALTEEGRLQVEKAISSLKTKEHVTKIYTSDFLRTKETAEIAADMLGIPREDIIVDHRLGECQAGDFDTKTWDEALDYFKSPKEHMFRAFPGGESFFDVKTRVTEFLYDIDEKHTNENILIISHGLPMRMMKYAAEGKTGRDLVRSGWQDWCDANAATFDLDWRQLPHNETWEIDVHRPYVDAITWQDSETGENMARINDVFDVWYDSGAMPFAQNHYPFEHGPLAKVSKRAPDEEVNPANRAASAPKELDLLDPASGLYPADFIYEGLDQTRGWFYSLLVLGVGIFDQSPYKSVGVNGLILAEDGRKMSKSLKNYPDMWPTIQKYGADSLRFFLASSPAVHAEEVAFSEKGLDEVNKKIFNRLENIASFLDMYAVDAQGKPEAIISEPRSDIQIANTLQALSHPLDIWAISRLNQVIENVTANMESYAVDKAMRSIAELIDDVSTWYLRRSRDRFKSREVFLHNGERQLNDGEEAMFTTRYLLEQIARLMAPVTPFIAEHMYQKVKFGPVLSVHLESWPAAVSADVNARLGTQSISEMSKVRELVERGLAMRSEAKIKVRQPLVSFTHDEAELTAELEEIIKDELNVKAVLRGDAMSLDTEVSEDLRKEGIARDIIRAIQAERKAKDLKPQDSIKISFVANASNESVRVIIEEYKIMIKETVSAGEIIYIENILPDLSGDGMPNVEGINLPFVIDVI